MNYIRYLGDTVRTANVDQTIAGVKNFTSSPIVPTPTTDYQAATKKYVDDKVATISTEIETTSSPVFGLLYNVTDDVYKRIGKNIN